MKIELLRRPDPLWRRPGDKSAEVRELAPFVWRDSQTYVHRPRSASIINDAHNFRGIKRRDGRKWSAARLCVSAWCGQTLHEPLMSDTAPPGRSVCATCDGRAIANGHPALDGARPDPRLTFRPYKCQPWGSRPSRYSAAGYRKDQA